MDVPDLAKLKQGIEKTIKGLQEAEKKNPEFPFSDWPSDPVPDYKLKPKKVIQSGNAQQQMDSDCDLQSQEIVS